MRRTYEYKQESYTIQESHEPWTYPSYKDYHVPSPKINNKMVKKPSFDQHYEPFDDHFESHTIYDHESHAYYDMDDHVKRNEHLAMGGRTILRPPLGSTNSMSHYQTTLDDDGHGMTMSPYRKAHRSYHDHNGYAKQGWCGAWHENNNNNNNIGYYDDYVKRNEHHAMEAKTILRPPLGSVGSPSHRSHPQTKFGHGEAGGNQIELFYNGGEYGEVQEGSGARSSSRNINNHGLEAKTYGEGHRKEDYYVGGLKGGVESLIKGLQGLPNGGMVKKIEVIEYERRVYNNSTGHYEWKTLGGSDHFMSNYPTKASHAKGF